MRKSLNSNWLLLVNTGPLLLLAFLCYGEFSVIYTLLKPGSIALWQQYGLALLGLGGANLAYLLWYRAGGRELSVGYGLAALLAYSLRLGLYTYYNEELVPLSYAPRAAGSPPAISPKTSPPSASPNCGSSVPAAPSMPGSKPG